MHVYVHVYVHVYMHVHVHVYVHVHVGRGLGGDKPVYVMPMFPSVCLLSVPTRPYPFLSVPIRSYPFLSVTHPTYPLLSVTCLSASYPLPVLRIRYYPSPV